MLGIVFARARAIESRTTQLARDSSSQTLVHVASQVMASQTRLKWLLGESELRLAESDLPCQSAGERSCDCTLASVSH